MSARTTDKGMFQGVITSNLALAILAAADGRTDILNLNFFADAIGTLKFYRPSIKTTAAADLSSGTALDIDTDASGFIDDGAVVTTNDFVIIADSAVGGSGHQLRAISNVGAVSSNVVRLTVASSDVQEDDIVYIVRIANVVSRATGVDEIVVDAKDQATSFPNFPLAIEVAATGTNELSGTFRTVDFN